MNPLLVKAGDERGYAVIVQTSPGTIHAHGDGNLAHIGVQTAIGVVDGCDQDLPLIVGQGNRLIVRCSYLSVGSGEDDSIEVAGVLSCAWNAIVAGQVEQAETIVEDSAIRNILQVVVGQ